MEENQTSIHDRKGVIGQIKNVITGVKGAGDAVRGNINAVADAIGEGISGNKPLASSRKHEGSEAWRGVAEKGSEAVKSSIHGIKGYSGSTSTTSRTTSSNHYTPSSSPQMQTNSQSSSRRVPPLPGSPTSSDARSRSVSPIGAARAGGKVASPSSIPGEEDAAITGPVNRASTDSHREAEPTPRAVEEPQHQSTSNRGIDPDAIRNAVANAGR